MKKLGHIAAALVLAAGVIYFIAVPKDDTAIAEFKQSAAAFIRSDKPSASLRDVLGRGGDQICVKYGDNGGMEITIQDYKVLTIMKGRRDVVVDGKIYTFKTNGDCIKFAVAKLSKDGNTLLLSGANSGSVKKTAVEKPKAKKKPVPAPEKKKPVQRSYGY